MPARNLHSEASSRLSAVFETATDGIIIINDKGMMEMVNQAAADLFGYEKAEMLGQNIKMLMPQPHRREHDQYINNYIETGIAKIIGIGREVKGKKKDGSEFPLRLSISEVKLSEKRAFTGILHDLSKEKAFEAEIKTLNAQLEKRVVERTEELATAINKLLNINQKLEHEVQERIGAERELRRKERALRKAFQKEKELNRLKSRFVSMASHEFRTPLSTILSSADLIEAYIKEEQQEKRTKHTTRIKSAVSNLTGILNDFLSLSKLEEGKVQSKPVTFDLGAFCLETIDELQGLLKDGQHIRYENPNGEISIFLDKKMLKNIFFNLLSNAIKYSDPGKPIDCRLEWENDLLRLSVQDYGIGIPEAEQQHLFTRFFRAHNVENIQGTGLGLNIVKRYVDLLGD
jgi:PAS domain S-box-containing protein